MECGSRDNKKVQRNNNKKLLCLKQTEGKTSRNKELGILNPYMALVTLLSCQILNYRIVSHILKNAYKATDTPFFLTFLENHANMMQISGLFTSGSFRGLFLHVITRVA